MFNEMRRKEERSKQGQTNNKAKQHSTPKTVTFPKKNEFSRMGLQPYTTLQGTSSIIIIDNMDDVTLIYLFGGSRVDEVILDGAGLDGIH